MFAFPGEIPVIDAIGVTKTGYVAGFPISLRNASWWHIKGLEIEYSSGGLVLYENCNNNIIETIIPSQWPTGFI
ncbi:MAG: hypothetical protein IPJ33_00825 [Gammaproteobacteria bacterium]|nr:hypothetical protein [Gammaproteobacteria bacterium]